MDRVLTLALFVVPSTPADTRSGERRNGHYGVLFPEGNCNSGTGETWVCLRRPSPTYLRACGRERRSSPRAQRVRSIVLDHLGRAQGLNLVGADSQLAQNLLGVLAEPRRWPIDVELLP